VLLQQMAVLIHQRPLRHVKIVYALLCYNILAINITTVSQSTLVMDQDEETQAL